MIEGLRGKRQLPGEKVWNKAYVPTSLDCDLYGIKDAAKKAGDQEDWVPPKPCSCCSVAPPELLPVVWAAALREVRTALGVEPADGKSA